MDCWAVVIHSFIVFKTLKKSHFGFLKISLLLLKYQTVWMKHNRSLVHNHVPANFATAWSAQSWPKNIVFSCIFSVQGYYNFEYDYHLLYPGSSVIFFLCLQQNIRIDENNLKLPCMSFPCPQNYKSFIALLIPLSAVWNRFFFGDSGHSLFSWKSLIFLVSLLLLRLKLLFLIRLPHS